MENVEQEERYAGKGIFIFGALLVLLVVCIIAITRNKKTEESGRDIKVLSIDGQATVYRDGEGYKNAYNGMEIISGDVISTGAGSYLSISMDGNKCIMVEPASTIILEAKGDDKHNRTQITVEKGAVISDIREALDEQSSYEVVTDNSSLRLLPYLSANLSFEVDRRNSALAVPNSALRFRPDESLIDGEFKREPKTRYIWVAQGEKVRPIKVKTSISDGAYTVIEAPELKENMEIVVGIETVVVSSAKTNPFMPKMPQRRKGNAPAKK